MKLISLNLAEWAILGYSSFHPKVDVSLKISVIQQVTHAT